MWLRECMQSQKAQVRATPAASNASSVRLGGARLGAPLSASRSSIATRAVKDYSAEHFAPSKTEVRSSATYS